MKRPVEIDTVNLSDRLDDLAGNASLVALAIIGLMDGQCDKRGGHIANLAYEIQDALHAISEEICPPSPEEIEKVHKRIKARFG